MIKVALLIPTLDQSGAEKQLTLLATGLPRDEFEVHVLALTRGGPYEQQLRDAGIPITLLSKRWKFDPIVFRRLKRWLKQHSPDVLHTWLFAANAYGRLAIGKSANTKVLVSERCVDTWKSGWQRWLDRKLIPRTDHLVGNSNSVIEFYRQLGYPEDKTSVIPNGVPQPQRLSDDERAAWLKSLDFPEDAKLIGFAGRLAPQKRLDDMVWTMQLLRSVRPEARLVIIGDGPKRDDLQDFVNHYDLGHLVRFVGHRSNADRLVASMDLFWLASDFEGMSNSLTEAMSAGVACVASDIPPNRELINDGEHGRLFKVGDSAELCRISSELLTDDKTRHELGSAAQQRMAIEFSIDSMIKAHADLYRHLGT